MYVSIAYYWEAETFGSKTQRLGDEDYNFELTSLTVKRPEDLEQTILLGDQPGFFHQDSAKFKQAIV